MTVYAMDSWDSYPVIPGTPYNVAGDNTFNYVSSAGTGRLFRDPVTLETTLGSTTQVVGADGEVKRGFTSEVPISSATAYFVASSQGNGNNARSYGFCFYPDRQVALRTTELSDGAQPAVEFFFLPANATTAYRPRVRYRNLAGSIVSVTQNLGFPEILGPAEYEVKVDISLGAVDGEATITMTSVVGGILANAIVQVFNLTDYSHTLNPGTFGAFGLGGVAGYGINSYAVYDRTQIPFPVAPATVRLYTPDPVTFPVPRDDSNPITINNTAQAYTFINGAVPGGQIFAADVISVTRPQNPRGAPYNVLAGHTPLNGQREAADSRNINLSEFHVNRVRLQNVTTGAQLQQSTLDIRTEFIP